MWNHFKLVVKNLPNMQKSVTSYWFDQTKGLERKKLEYYENNMNIYMIFI